MHHLNDWGLAGNGHNTSYVFGTEHSPTFKKYNTTCASAEYTFVSR